MESVLVVLYQSKNGQTWCAYHGGIAEADDEFRLMSKHDETLEERARIEVKKTAKLISADF